MQAAAVVGDDAAQTLQQEPARRLLVANSCALSACFLMDQSGSMNAAQWVQVRRTRQRSCGGCLPLRLSPCYAELSCWWLPCESVRWTECNPLASLSTGSMHVAPQVRSFAASSA